MGYSELSEAVFRVTATPEDTALRRLHRAVTFVGDHLPVVHRQGCKSGKTIKHFLNGMARADLRSSSDS